MSRVVIEIIFTRSGQPRPYADSVYEGTIIFSNYWDSSTGEREGAWDPDIAVVKQTVQLYLHRFTEPKTAMEPWLDLVEKVDRGRWHVRVIAPYLD